MSDTLTDFLLARIADRKQGVGQIHDAACGYVRGIDDMPIPEWCDCGEPALVLAECEAKRRIVELCQMAIRIGEIKPGTTWNDDAGGAEIAEATLMRLALPYDAHPDYRLEWAV